MDVFMQGLVHHADGGGTAAGQTFYELDAYAAVIANENWIVNSVMCRGNPRSRAKVFHQAIAARHCATQCPADANVRFAHALLPQHRIKCHQLENVDRLQLQFLRDPFDAPSSNEAELFLPEMQQRQGGAAFMLRRVLPDDDVDPPLEFRRN